VRKRLATYLVIKLGTPETRPSWETRCELYGDVGNAVHGGEVGAGAGLVRN